MLNNDIVPGFDDDKIESLKISLRKVPDMEGCLLLILSGYIDTYNSNNFQKRINLAIDAGYIRLIFHCGGLTYVSSTGIGSFTAFLKTVKHKDGDLILLELQPKVFEVFQLLGFSRFFNIKDSIDDALEFFRNSALSDASTIFPAEISCPFCSKKLKAVKPGRFRCSECKDIIAVNNAGQVILE